MKQLGFLVGAALVLGSPAAYAQSLSPYVAATVRLPPYVMPGQIPPPAPRQPPALFTINGLPVRVAAPAMPTYDVAANRNLAADPLNLGPMGVGMNPPVPWMLG